MSKRRQRLRHHGISAAGKSDASGEIVLQFGALRSAGVRIADNPEEARALRAQGRGAEAAAVEARFRAAWAEADVDLPL